MRNNTIKIEKRRGRNILWMFFLTPISMMFFFISIKGILSERDYFWEYIALVFAFFISIIGFSYFFTSLFRIISRNPEYELTDDSLIIYDNSKYKKIDLGEILECHIYRFRYSTWLQLHIKPTSLLRSNENKFLLRMHNRNNKNFKKIFLLLDYAKINPNEFASLINSRIEKLK